ncbi:MAG: C39 family peptidase [Ruminococcus sp.]|nr:C39 family peptidase [Ruminococcus sp.]
MNKVRSRILGGLVGALMAAVAAAGLLLFLNSQSSDTVSKDENSTSAVHEAESRTDEPASKADAPSEAEAPAESTAESEAEAEPELSIELTTKDYTYTGEEITPEYTVKLEGKELDEDDFEAALSNNIEVGKATLTVTSGDLSAKKSFRIVPAAPKVSQEYTSTSTYVTISWEPTDQTDYYSISKYTDMTDAEKKALEKEEGKKKDEDADEGEEDKEDDEASEDAEGEDGETVKPAHCGRADADETSYTDKTVQSGMVYRYVVRSCTKKDDKNYDSCFSEEIKAVTLPEKPGMPTLSADKKNIVWTPSAKCDGYEVLMAESGKELKSSADTEKTTAPFKAKSMVTVVIRAYIECDGVKYYSLQSDPALLEPAVTDDSSEGEEGGEEPAIEGASVSGSKKLQVTNILQNPELPTGCETTSLTILLNYLGYPADKVTLARNYLPKQSFYWENGEMYGADFRTTFAGDPEDSYSYGCYAPCIVTTANSYLSATGASARARDLTGTDLDTLLVSCINSGSPVLIWITSANLHETALTTVWKTPAGNQVQWVAYEHCVVLSGYDADAGLIYVADPLVGNTSYSYSLLRQRYIDMGSQAVKIA